MATDRHPRIKADKQKKASQTEVNKETAYRLYLSGYGVCEIAKKMGYQSHSTVSKLIQEALQDHKTANDSLGMQVKELELKRLDELQSVFYKEALLGDKDAFYVVKNILELRSKYLGLASPTEVKTELHTKLYVGCNPDLWDEKTQTLKG